MLKIDNIPKNHKKKIYDINYFISQIINEEISILEIYIKLSNFCKKINEILKDYDILIYNSKNINVKNFYNEQKQKFTNIHKLELLLCDDFLLSYPYNLNLPLHHSYKNMLFSYYISNLNNFNFITYECCGEFIFDSINYVCENCGKTFGPVLISDIKNLNYKDQQECEIINKPVYKRSAHFLYKLKNRIRPNSQNIPVKIINQVKRKIKIEKLNLNNLSPEIILDILKKLNLQKYYNMNNVIFERITNNTKNTISDEELNNIEIFFNKVEQAFENLKDKGRKSMFVYDYTIYKILEILKYDKYKDNFKLPKNPDKINEYDKLWEKICEIINCEFISTKRF